MKKLILVFAFFLFKSSLASGQCGSGTPVFIVDLSYDANATWLSPSIARNDTCCGSTSGCVQFIITLHPDAEGIIFDIASGAIPGGALFYQVDCGPSSALSESICLSGVGPHSVTFCKPGLNENVYSLTSIAEPAAGDDVSITEGCTRIITSIGFEPSTILWRSVYPGVIGEYNSLLDCTFQCDTVVVTAPVNPPPYIDFQICGFALGLCESIGVCDTVRVFFSDSLSVTIAPENPMVCVGDAVTSITANAIDGIPPYSYLWSTGEITQSIDVGAGLYNVLVSDSGGCYSITASVNVGSFLQVITADAGTDQVLCNQSPQVQLSGSVTGVLTGLWKGGNGAFTPDRTTLNAVYTPTQQEIDNGLVDILLLTTNTSNCLPDSDVVSIYFIGFIGDIVAINDSSTCYNSNDASAECIISNGYQSYSYLWNDSSASTSSSISNLYPGTYTVIITDSLACDTSISVSVEEPDELVIYAINKQDVDCFGDSTGQATVYVSGGNAYYNYNWGIESNNQTSQTAINLAANTYFPIVTDLKGCSADTMLSISESTAISLIVDSLTNIKCFGDSSGKISVSASGGNSPYLFSWDENADNQIGPTASALSAGIYTVQVIDSYSCTDSIEVVLTQAEELITSTNVLQQILCNGANDGIAEVIISGGVQPYSVLWDSLANYQTTLVAINLPAGHISVSILDSNNCNFIEYLDINQPDSALYLQGESEDVDCFGNNNGSAQVIVSGGTYPYSYLWSANANSQTSSSIENLIPDIYWVWVNDSNNCRDSLSFQITEPELLTIDPLVTHVNCFGDSTGRIVLNVQGGNTPYSYVWSENVNAHVDSVAYDLIADEYFFTVIDAKACSDSNSVLLNQGSELIVQASENQNVCANDLVEVSAQISGGTGSITCVWTDLGIGTVQNFIASESEMYIVQAIDSLGCVSNYDSSIVNVMNIFLDSLEAENNGGYCQGGSTFIYAEFTGQDSIYSYSWSSNLGSSFGPIQVSPLDSTWYVFTITDQCNNSLSDSTLVEVYPFPEIDLEISTNDGCAPLTVDFQNISNQTDLSYIWLFGDGGASTEESPMYIYEDAGEFLVELQVFNIYGCSANSSNTSFVNVFASPTSNFYADPWETDIEDPNIQFSNSSSSDAMFFTWSFDDGDTVMIENPLHTFVEVGEFNVYLETENIEGCKSSITKTVTINPTHDLVIPNAFTPNTNGSPGGYYDPNDLSNDIFYPFAVYIADFNMMIFNRWGELIFESTEINFGWDGYYKGKLSEIGAYVYKIDLTFIDGYSVTKQGKIKLIN